MTLTDSPSVGGSGHSNRKEAASVTANLVAFLRDYAHTRLNSRLFDARRCVAPYVVLDFGRRGLLGLRVPQLWGGLGLSWLQVIPIIEQLAAIDLTLTIFVGIHNELGIGPVLGFGSQDAKDELLPLLATGRMLGGFAMTEEGAGSNPRAITGTAEQLADGQWRLRAKKIWVGNGSWAGVLNVFARQEDRGRLGGFVGLSVLTDKPGVHVGAEAMTMGLRGIVQTRVDFDGVHVDSRHLLGNGDAALEVAEASFHMARFGLAIASSGATKRCAQLLGRYAGRRQIASGPLVDNPVFRRAFLRILHSIEVLNRLTALVAGQLDAHAVIPDLFFVCKALGPEYLGFAADALVQFLGGRGYIEANEAPQLLRDARLLRIFEGPTETMFSHLGSRWQSAFSLRAFLRIPEAGRLVLERIETACQEIERAPAAPGTSLGQHAYARYSAAGELIAHGVAWWLLAVGGDPAAADWARLVFEDVRLRTLREVGASLGFDADWVREELARTIGDVAQTLPGEEWAMDRLLLPPDPGRGVV